MVDMQTGFVSGDHAVPSAEKLVPVVRRLLERARAAGSLVVHLQNDGAPGTPDEPGTGTWRLHLPAEAGEPVISKSVDDGFDRTELGAILVAHGIRRLAICGVQSEMCVGATARTALDRGYGVVLPHDAHATYDVPAPPGGTEGVPAAQAARVAEWALGDGVEVVATSAEVTFAPGIRP